MFVELSTILPDKNSGAKKKAVTKKAKIIPKTKQTKQTTSIKDFYASKKDKDDNKDAKPDSEVDKEDEKKKIETICTPSQQSSPT